MKIELHDNLKEPFFIRITFYGLHDGHSLKCWRFEFFSSFIINSKRFSMTLGVKIFKMLIKSLQNDRIFSKR